MPRHPSYQLGVASMPPPPPVSVPHGALSDHETESAVNVSVETIYDNDNDESSSHSRDEKNKKKKKNIRRFIPILTRHVSFCGCFLPAAIMASVVTVGWFVQLHRRSKSRKSTYVKSRGDNTSVHCKQSSKAIQCEVVAPRISYEAFERAVNDLSKYGDLPMHDACIHHKPDFVTCVVRPPMVSPRIYTIQVKKHNQGNFTWKLAKPPNKHAQTQSDHLKNKYDAYPMAKNEGEWRIRAAGKGGKGTHAFYESRSEPGGSVPARVATWGEARTAPDVMRHFAKAASK